MRLLVPRSLAALLLAASGLALSACSSLPAQYCTLGGECDDRFAFLDPVPGSSADSVDVCIVNQDTLLASLRANREEVCHEMAAAWEAWMLCVVEEDTCDSFQILEDDCKDEFQDYAELADEAGNRCNE